MHHNNRYEMPANLILDVIHLFILEGTFTTWNELSRVDERKSSK
jgi:hypothetical protein